MSVVRHVLFLKSHKCGPKSQVFTVVPQLMGMGICSVSTVRLVTDVGLWHSLHTHTTMPDWLILIHTHNIQGIDITFAVNEDHNVYVFGSMGIGPTGNTEKIPEDNVPDLKYNSPVRVEYLKVSSRNCYPSCWSSVVLLRMSNSVLLDNTRVKMS